MSFLLKIHYLLALFVAKGMPNQGKCCRWLRKVVEDVVGFGDGEFLTDLRIALVDCLKNLSLTLVNCLKTLASEHVNLLGRKICLKQTT